MLFVFYRVVQQKCLFYHNLKFKSRQYCNHTWPGVKRVKLTVFSGWEVQVYTLSLSRYVHTKGDEIVTICSGCSTNDTDTVSSWTLCNIDEIGSYGCLECFTL